MGQDNLVGRNVHFKNMLQSGLYYYCNNLRKTLRNLGSSWLITAELFHPIVTQQSTVQKKRWRPAKANTSSSLPGGRSTIQTNYNYIASLDFCNAFLLIFFISKLHIRERNCKMRCRDTCGNTCRTAWIFTSSATVLKDYKTSINYSHPVTSGYV